MLWHMRTTLRINDKLMADAKRRALETGRTLTAVVEDALRQALYRSPRAARGRVQLPTFGRGGARPGTDLNDSAALEDVMAGRE